MAIGLLNPKWLLAQRPLTDDLNRILPLHAPQHDRRNPGPQNLLQLRPYLPLLRRVVTKGKVEEIRERKVVMNKEMVRVSMVKNGSKKTV